MSILFKPKTKGLKLYASTVLSLLLANCSPSYATATPKQGFYNNYYDYVMSNYSNNHNKKPLSVLYITDNQSHFTYLTASKNKGLFILTLDAVAVASNNEILSKHTISVSPQRHCGFFMPIVQQDGSIAPLWRVDTPKYNTLTGNMGSSTNGLRVKLATRYSQYRVVSSQKPLGVAHHG